MTEAVSIVIPCYHSGKYIKQCAQSLIDQSFEDWRAYFIIDDFEFDDTLETLRGFNEPRFLAIYRKSKTTCSLARNAGFDLSAGEFVAFMDSDDWWEPNKLAVQVDYMRKYYRLQWTSHWFIEHRNGLDFLRPTHPGDFPSIGSVATILFRRDCLLHQRVLEGGSVFNEKMDRVDDGDLVLRILDYPHANIESFLYHYRWTPESLTGTTSPVKESWIITKMCFRRRAWKYFWYYLKNTVACIIGA